MNTVNENSKKIKHITFLGVMLATVIVLSIFEHMVPPIPFLPPNVKLGLSNIVIMYCLFFTGKKDALYLALLKSLFVLFTRGVTAGILSLSGGILSLSVMIFIIYVFKDKSSYLIISIFGAIFHNLGQIIAVCAIMDSGIFIYYFPILLVSGVFMGSITGVTLKIVMPALEKIFKSE